MPDRGTRGAIVEQPAAREALAQVVEDLVGHVEFERLHRGHAPTLSGAADSGGPPTAVGLRSVSGRVRVGFTTVGPRDEHRRPLPSPSMEHTLENPVVVEFPLRGEGWMAVTTPAHRVPSHGTDMLGQRYAYDLLKVDQRRGVHYHPAATLRGELIGGRTRESYAWGAPIHAPFDAEVVRAVDGMPEREWIHPARELALMLKNAFTFTPEKLPLIMGNHVLLRLGRRLRRVRAPRAGHGRGGRRAARAHRRRARAGSATPATRRRRTCTSS